MAAVFMDANSAANTMWDSLLLQCVGPAPSVDTVFISLEVPIPSCGTGTVWDPVAQECIVAIPTDTDFDGCIAAGDLLNLLGTFGSCPPIPEWPDTPSDTTGTSWMRRPAPLPRVRLRHRPDRRPMLVRRESSVNAIAGWS